MTLQPVAMCVPLRSLACERAPPHLPVQQPTHHRRKAVRNGPVLTPDPAASANCAPRIARMRAAAARAVKKREEQKKAREAAKAAELAEAEAEKEAEEKEAAKVRSTPLHPLGLRG